MSYHRFPNLYELYGGDTNKKLNSGVQSLDFLNRYVTANSHPKYEENVPTKENAGTIAQYIQFLVPNQAKNISVALKMI